MFIYLLFVISSILHRYTSGHAGYSAVCFLTYRPALETIEFAQELAQDLIDYSVDVFIMIDDNNFNASNVSISRNFQLLQISNQECIYYGYQKTISLATNWREVTSWDKALFYFTLLNDIYTFVWLIENDVFIPSSQAFLSVHQLYSNTSDLIVARNEINLLGDASKWLWSKAIGQLAPPWSCSMVNVVGLSRSMLIAIDDHVHWLGEVPFHEFFFNTLAMQLNMTIVSPPELSTIVFEAIYSFEQVSKQPNNFWHPFKDLNKQKSWRQILANQSLAENSTAESIDIATVCHSNLTMMKIEQHLTNLLAKFDINKSKFSSTNRLGLRQTFLNVAKQCQERNASKTVISLVMKLADYAYKLPELQIEKLIKNKSLNHVRLDKALKENKKAIFRSLSNSSTVAQLRKQTNSLIDELRREIQREFQQEQKIQNHTNFFSFASMSTSTSMPSSLSSLLSSSFFSLFLTTSINRFSPSHSTLSTNHLTSLKINKSLNMSKKYISNQLFDGMNDKIQTLFFILLSICTLFVLFQRRKVRT